MSTWKGLRFREKTFILLRDVRKRTIEHFSKNKAMNEMDVLDYIDLLVNENDISVYEMFDYVIFTDRLSQYIISIQ